MTSSKSVSWSALVNIGNNESLALTVSGEAANPDEARDIFAFACGQLLGVANSADEATAPLIRAYVSRLVQTEEARPVEQDAPAPTPKKEAWEPKITKSSYDKMCIRDRVTNAANTVGAGHVVGTLSPDAPEKMCIRDRDLYYLRVRSGQGDTHTTFDLGPATILVVVD